MSAHRDTKISLEKFGYQQQLNRSLGLWQLVAFGLNYMIPFSPAIFFGFVLSLSGGTVALPFIIAGVAVFFTALSYAVMVQHFPLAGSTYNFISAVWNKKAGFIAGWILLLDYLFITSVTSMSASLYVVQLIHAPYALVLGLFILITGIINILGIQLLAWMSLILLFIAEVIVILSFIVWSHQLHFSELFSLSAFHFSNVSSLMSATALAIASYLGFDAITTLAEEAKKPIKTIPKAIFICVFLGGLGMVLTGYLGVLACPNWSSLIQNPDWQATALFHISEATGGKNFAVLYSIGFILSMAVFNIVAIAATARLIFGMGRDNVIKKKIFARVHHRFKTPHFNIIFIMIISFIVGCFAQIDEIASLVNYGALFGFAWLNIAVIWLYFKNTETLIYQNRKANFCRYLLCPLLGFMIITWVFLSLSTPTHILGSLWLAIGLIYAYTLKL